MQENESHGRLDSVPLAQAPSCNLVDSFFRAVPLFAGFSEDELKFVISVAQYRHYQKRSVIFHATDPGSAVFILKAGMVKVSIVHQTGREAIVHLLHPKDFFGEMAFLDGSYRSATIVAVEEVEAYLVEGTVFSRLLNMHPKLLLTVLGGLCKRLRQMNDKVGRLIFTDIYERVGGAIMELAETRGQRKEGVMVIDLPLSRQELASFIGITRQTLSSVFHKHQLAGVLAISGRRLSILDESRFLRDPSIAPLDK